ncbi:MAG: T9SS type A sorting domain-containing protein [Sphingobacteriaceae bacterium]|nr:T9SS type A sorting domain-containing protein [Sphingobacteriaceae bacterium]
MEIFDNIGQHVKNIANFISITSGYQQDINFKEIGLKPGMYFISITINGKVTNTRVDFD